MKSITTEQARIRYLNLPVVLRDAIFDDRDTDIIRSVSAENSFNNDQSSKLGSIVGWVLLGFLSIDDVGKEISAQCGVDATTGERISGRLYDRIFAFIKNELRENYKPDFTEDERKVLEKIASQQPKIAVAAVVENKPVELGNLPEGAQSFISGSLSPLGNQLQQQHPEAPATGTSIASSIIQPPKPQSTPQEPPTPVFLHQESEVAPLDFDFDIAAELSTATHNETVDSLKNQLPSHQPSVAQVQLGSPASAFKSVVSSLKTEPASVSPVTSVTVDSVDHPSKEEKQEFVPLVKTSSPEKEMVLLSLDKKSEESTPFTLLSTEIPASASPKTADVTTITTPSSTAVPVVDNTTKEAPIASIPEIQEVPVSEPTKKPTSFLGKMLSNITRLGEKPAPVLDRVIGPPLRTGGEPVPAGAKVVDYSAPAPVKQETSDMGISSIPSSAPAKPEYAPLPENPLKK